MTEKFSKKNSVPLSRLNGTRKMNKLQCRSEPKQKRRRGTTASFVKKDPLAAPATDCRRTAAGCGERDGGVRRSRRQRCDRGKKKGTSAEIGESSRAIVPSRSSRPVFRPTARRVPPRLCPRKPRKSSVALRFYVVSRRVCLSAGVSRATLVVASSDRKPLKIAADKSCNTDR